MSEMTRRDHYICAYIAQGKTYDQAKMIFEMECEHNPGLGDTALSAAGEKDEFSPAEVNKALNAENGSLRAEIVRLREELAKYTGDLTDEQVEESMRISLIPFAGEATCRNYDKALRKVRSGEGE